MSSPGNAPDGVAGRVFGLRQMAMADLMSDLRVDRVIYTTITLMSVLVVYDGWASLTFWGAVAVIVGPMLCIFLGHVFGAALGTRVEIHW